MYKKAYWYQHEFPDSKRNCWQKFVEYVGFRKVLLLIHAVD